jgi:hypothetical protein
VDVELSELDAKRAVDGETLLVPRGVFNVSGLGQSRPMEAEIALVAADQRQVLDPRVLDVT